MRTDVDPITLGIYFLVLFAAFVVLAFVLEFVAFVRDAMRAPISEAANERWPPQLDRRVLFRLAVVSGLAALAFAAAIIVGYSLDPRQTEWVLAWVRDDHPSSLMLVGGVFCAAALLCGVQPRQPVLLFCLTLPGLVIMPLLLIPDIVHSKNVVDTVLGDIFMFFLQPGALILLFIAIGQSRLLRKPGGDLTSGGFVRLVLISFSYNYGLF